MTVHIQQTPSLHTAVPHEQSWIRQLAAGLDRRGHRWQALVLADGYLRVEADTAEGTLIFEIHPRGKRQQAMRIVGNHCISYRGRGDLTPAAVYWLDGLVNAIEDLSPAPPANLSGHAAMVKPIGLPEKVLEKMFPFITVEHSSINRHTEDSPRGEITEVLVRATSRCNQRCAFCSAPEHAEPDPRILAASLRAAADLLPGAMLSLTGGEPTLRKDFSAQLELALRLDFSRIQIQTNAVTFAEKLDPGCWPADGRLTFFVSLHAVNAGLYDAITSTHGQLDAALAGIRRLLESKRAVTINTVITSHNIDHLEQLVGALPELFPGPNRPQLHFSTLICPEWRPRAAEFLVPYRQLAKALQRAAAVAGKLDLETQPLLASTHASLPACLLPARARRQRHRYHLAAGETGYEDYSRPWIKAAGCRECSQDGNCLGVPRAYARRFGLDELKPI